MMSSVSLNWSMSADPEATRTLAEWSTNIRNAAPAFNEMADYIAASQKDWFKTKGNGTWAPLSPDYAAWKRKRFPKRGILHGPDRPGHRGFQLRDELTKRPFGYEKITARSLTLGTDLPYAMAHARGTAIMPKRPPLKPIDTITARALTHIMRTHIVGETLGL